MNSSDLHPEQAAAVAQSLEPHAKYLSRLVRRMEQLRWPRDDPLYARALRARDAVDSLLQAMRQTQEENGKPRWRRAMTK